MLHFTYRNHTDRQASHQQPNCIRPLILSLGFLYTNISILLYFVIIHTHYRTRTIQFGLKLIWNYVTNYSQSCLARKNQGHCLKHWTKQSDKSSLDLWWISTCKKKFCQSKNWTMYCSKNSNTFSIADWCQFSSGMDLCVRLTLYITVCMRSWKR